MMMMKIIIIKAISEERTKQKTGGHGVAPRVLRASVLRRFLFPLPIAPLT
jgi:hypothetical protein